MENYDQIKQHLLNASELLAPKDHDKMIAMVGASEEDGSDQKVIVRNLLSHMHMRIVHFKT